MKRSSPHFVTLTLLLLVPATPSFAPGQEKATQEKAQPSTTRPKIGLVLSGGGARGAAHVGVLKVLEELRIPIDMIAGNSMGTIIGASYAYGYSPKEMQEILININWPLVLKDGLPRDELSFRRKQDDANFLIDLALGFRDFSIVLPKGLVHGHHNLNIFRFMTPQSWKLKSFDELPIPFRAVATEIGTGKEVVLASGSLPLAMAASMAIPGVFAPVVIDGKQLIDGMVVNNIPIDVAKSMGADVIIAIDIGTPMMKPEEITSLFSVTGQMLNILMQKNVDERLKLIGEEDTLISPELGDITSGGFDRIKETIDLGESAARAMIDRLRKYSVSEEEYAAFLANQRRDKTEKKPVIDRITIVNNSALGDGVLRSKMNTKVGEKIDAQTLRDDINRIFGMEDFERVTWEFETLASGENELRILADEKSWGPNYIRFGLNIEDNLDGDAAYNFGINYTMRTLNRLGGEWRNEFQIGKRNVVLSEFYQPLTESGSLFVAPIVEYRTLPINSLQNGTKVAEFDVQFGQVGFDVGSLVSNWAELRFGIRRSAGDVDVDVSTIPLAGFTFDNAQFRASLLMDTVDDVNFPSSGGKFEAVWEDASTDLGADVSYQRLAVSGGYAMTFSKNTFIVTADFGTALSDTLPPYALHQRGGFLGMSGLEEGELTGQHAQVSKAIYYRQISGDRIKTLGMPVYVGGSVEYGNVWDRRDDIFDDMLVSGSGFLGLDSPLGPLYFGYGYSEGGRDSVYLFLGATF